MLSSWGRVPCIPLPNVPYIALYFIILHCCIVIVLCFAWLYLITFYDVIFIIRFIFVFITYISLIMCKYAPIHQTVVNVVALDLGFNLIMLAHDWARGLQSSNSGVSVEAIVASTVNSVVVSHVSKKTATGAYWWQPKKDRRCKYVVLNRAILLLKEVHFLESIALFGFHVATVVLRWAVSVAQWQAAWLPDHFFRRATRTASSSVWKSASYYLPTQLLAILAIYFTIQ